MTNDYQLSPEERKNRKLFVYSMLILELNPNLDRQKIEDWRDGFPYKELEDILAKWGILQDYGTSNR